MKNLFLITEEEKKRILNSHKNATKRQYLNESKLIDGRHGKILQLDKENQITKSIYNLLVDQDGTLIGDVDETKLVNELIKIKDKTTFNQINNELINLFKQHNNETWVSKTSNAMDYNNLNDVLNDVLDYNLGDEAEIDRLIDHLTSLGIDKNLTKGFRGGTIDMATVMNSIKTPELKTDSNLISKWEKFSCVPNYPNAKEYKEKDGTPYYGINGEYYFSSGNKYNKNKVIVKYTCNDPEFTKSNKNSDTIQNKESTQKSVQISIPSDEDFDKYLAS